MESLCAALNNLERSDPVPKISVKGLKAPGGDPVIDMKKVETQYGPALVANILYNDQPPMDASRAGSTTLEEKSPDDLAKEYAEYLKNLNVETIKTSLSEFLIFENESKAASNLRFLRNKAIHNRRLRMKRRT